MASGYSLGTEIFFKSSPGNYNMQPGLRSPGYTFHSQNFYWEGSTIRCKQLPTPMTLDDIRQYLWGPGERTSSAELLHHGNPHAKASGPVLLTIPSLIPQTFVVSLLWILLVLVAGGALLNKIMELTFYFHSYCWTQNNCFVMLKKNQNWIVVKVVNTVSIQKGI